MRLVLIPGWNENRNAMDAFVKGRHRIPGFAASGFTCAVFDGGRGSLTDRIDQFAQFLAGVHSADGSDDPVALFGYSAGGLIARGLLRAGYSDVRIAAIFQLGAPNAGIVTDNFNGLMQRLHFSKSVVADMDIESRFMRWLNGTLGHWVTETGSGEKRWKVNGKPWVAGDVPIFNLAGRLARYRDRSDGVVIVESASLDGHVPCEFLTDKSANHLNLSGSWNPFTLLLRRWPCNDRLWPLAVQAATRFFQPR
jgi:hypothetical protein